MLTELFREDEVYWKVFCVAFVYRSKGKRTVWLVKALEVCFRRQSESYFKLPFSSSLYIARIFQTSLLCCFRRQSWSTPQCQLDVFSFMTCVTPRHRACYPERTAVNNNFSTLPTGNILLLVAKAAISHYSLSWKSFLVTSLITTLNQYEWNHVSVSRMKAYFSYADNEFSGLRNYPTFWRGWKVVNGI